VASCGERGVEFFEQRGQAVFSKERQRTRQAAAGFQRAMVEILGLQRGICTNLRGDMREEGALLGGERFAGCGFLPSEPDLEALLREFWEWREFGLLPGGKADEGNEIGERFAGFCRIDAVGAQARVAFPDFRRGEVIRAAFHGRGEFADEIVGEMPFRVGAVINNLKGEDAVLVFGQKLLKIVDVAARLFLVVPSALDDGVGTEVVHGNFGTGLQLDEQRAEGGVVKGFDGGFLERGGGGFDLRSNWFGISAKAVRTAGFSYLQIEINALAERLGEFGGDLPALGADAFPVGGFKRRVESKQAAGEGGKRLVGAVAAGDFLQELLEGDVGRAFEGLGGGLGALGHAHGIHQDEMSLGFGIGRDGAEFVRVNDARAATFHLLVIDGGAYVAQEHDDFEWLNVRAGGNHVHGDDDAELR
jgi:hypothetical protein